MADKNKTQKLPTEVYYLVLNGAKQYFKNKEDAEEMARKLYEDGTNPGGIYPENDPDEIQDLYDAGYFHEGDDKLDHEVVNDFSIDAIKDNFTPPGARKGHLEEDYPPETKITKEDEERFGKDALKGLGTIDTNDNGKIEVDEMADFQKSLDDYAAKNKKGREDIPATYKR